MLREVELGKKLHEARLQLGWSAEQAASFYGSAFKGIPITRKAYLKMEEGYLPQSLNRRAILAGMFGLVPTLLLSVRTQETDEDIARIPASKEYVVNSKSFRSKLLMSWNQGYKGNAEEALRDT